MAARSARSSGLRSAPFSVAVLLAGLGCAACVRAPVPATRGQAGQAAAPAPVSVAVRSIHGKPTILVDGAPETPMIYSITDSPGGQWSWNEFPRWNIANFARAGYRIVQFSLWLQDLWREDGTLDLDLARRQLRGVLEAAPGAVLFLRLHINAPFWWNRAHPEETVEYADVEGKLPEEFWGIRRHVVDAYDLEGGRLHSLASERWRADTTEVLRRLLGALADSPEGNALGFVNVCTGVSHEWHYWGFLKHDPDTSAPMTRHFRGWLRRKYGDVPALRAAWDDPAVTFESARVPGSQARNRTLDGVFRDPRRERAVMDYYEAQHEIVADQVLYFDGLIKRLWPRPIAVGNFYGYYFSTFSRQTTGGHLAVARILRSPEVDFLAAPQSYFGPSHGMGGSGRSRALVESARLHGKLVLDEMDQRTQVRHPFDEPPPEQRADDLALIRRNTVAPLSRGAGMWFFDFGPGRLTGWWSHPDYTAEARALKALFDARRDRPHVPAADVLVVWDTDSYYDVAAGWTPISETTLDYFSEDLHRAGVALDDVFFDDLPLVDLSRYRAVVFANVWRLDAARRARLREVVQSGRHVVFQYLPGYSDGARTGWELVRDATGIAVAPGAPTGHAITRVASDELPEASFGVPEYRTSLAPLPVVVDAEAEALGRLASAPAGAAAAPTVGPRQPVTLARKRRPDGGVTWYSSLPLRSPAVLRAIFRAAGAHVYGDDGDPLGAGNGVLWLHSKEGGARRIRLRDGREVRLDVAPRSTVVLDEATGARLLP